MAKHIQMGSKKKVRKGAVQSRINANKKPLLKAGGLKITRPPCMGALLAGYYAELSKEINTLNLTEDERGGAMQVMHLTDMNVCNWCGCDRCMQHIERIESILEQVKENSDERLRITDDMSDGSQQAVDGRADSGCGFWDLATEYDQRGLFGYERTVHLLSM